MKVLSKNVCVLLLFICFSFLLSYFPEAYSNDVEMEYDYEIEEAKGMSLRTKIIIYYMVIGLIFANVILLDASKIQSRNNGRTVGGYGPAIWFIIVLTSWLAGIPLYLIERSKPPEEIRKNIS